MAGWTRGSRYERAHDRPCRRRAVSPWRLRWRRFRQHRAGMGSLVVLALLLVFVAAANPVAHVLGVDPYETDLLSQYGPPSPEHPLGTDDAGRDELVRLMLGGQISLLVGVLSTLAGSVIGLTVGVISGYFGKRAGRPADALHRRDDRLAAAAAADRARRDRPDQTGVLGGVRAFRRRRLLAGGDHRGPGRLDRHRAADPSGHARAA